MIESNYKVILIIVLLIRTKIQFSRCYIWYNSMVD